MSTDEPSRRRPRPAAFALSLALAGVAHLLAPPAGAHPVSQGRLEVSVSPDRVSVLAVVSNEEVLVAAAARGRDASPIEIRRGHGDYLLAHLRVEAEGRTLAGEVVRRPDALAGRPAYVLEYRLPAPRPARLAFREDVLREFEFAPGVPWEASYLVYVRQEDGPPRGASLLTCREPLEVACDWPSDAPGRAVAPVQPRHLTAMAFVRHGIMHILTGYDHLLFVAALLLAARSLWDLVKVVSAFSLAHTLTLAASALDVFRLPEQVVEPMIAASIVFAAALNLVRPAGGRSVGRTLTAFLFGLFHGLGYAGGLLESMSGSNPPDLAATVAAFGAGVEIGHQAVVLPAFALLCLVRRSGDAPARLVERAGSAAIAALGAVYFASAIQ